MVAFKDAREGEPLELADHATVYDTFVVIFSYPLARKVVDEG